MAIKPLFISVLFVHLLASSALPADQQSQISPEQRNFFENRIRPVLVENCYKCHSAESKKLGGGLRLDHREGLLAGGDSGPAIVPGKLDESLLLDALRHDGLEMPPSGKLPQAVVADFETWVRMGAPDPRTAANSSQSVTRSPGSIDLESGRKHWAYQPVQNPVLPSVRDNSWSSNPIDQFILSRLESAQIKPQPDADRYTWLRRVSLDLTGLPPTPAEINAFINDSSPQARHRVVDRLLASPAFGERWARHWLDMIGYADQVGTSNNVFAEHAWRYRDYLINAFNNDLPFDRFIREQIAGDLLPHETASQRSANLVATGFLVLGDVDIVNPDKLKLEADLADQQVSKLGMVFLGQTIGCARCHDHKFDPIELEDYYALSGMFRSTRSAEKIDHGVWSGVTTAQLPETPDQKAQRLLDTSRHAASLVQLKSEQARLNQEKADIAEKQKSNQGDLESLKKRSTAVDQRLRQLRGLIEHAEFFRPAPPRTFAVSDKPNPADTMINVRGNPYATGAQVPRGVVKVVSWGPPPVIPKGQSGRLQLANWLADPRNPLTARITVNRIWQKLFGEGIVRSVDYFGTRGEKPSHPELLDYLANSFIHNGWSQKQLVRSIVLSRTYRQGSGLDEQASQRDPENRLLWRMNRQRLDAEALRDSMLAISGELISNRGGPAIPLEFPENSSSLQPKAVNPPAFNLNKFRPEQEFQRTVYLPVVRSAQPELARIRDLFDFTQPAQTAGRRPQTVVPTQALFLLNNSLPRKRASALAAALINQHKDPEKRLQTLWLKLYNRPITEGEASSALAFLAGIQQASAESTSTQDQSTAEKQTQAWLELCHALFSTNEFLFRQ